MPSQAHNDKNGIMAISTDSYGRQYDLDKIMTELQGRHCIRKLRILFTPTYAWMSHWLTLGRSRKIDGSRSYPLKIMGVVSGIINNDHSYRLL